MTDADFDTNSDSDILACPECDEAGSNVYRRTGDHAHDWYCAMCHTEFDHPVQRERRDYVLNSTSDVYDTLARADPDAIGEPFPDVSDAPTDY